MTYGGKSTSDIQAQRDRIPDAKPKKIQSHIRCIESRTKRILLMKY